MKKEEPSIFNSTAEDWKEYFNDNYSNLSILLKRYDFIRTASRTVEHDFLVSQILELLAKQITSTLAKIQTENLFKNE